MRRIEGLKIMEALMEEVGVKESIRRKLVRSRVKVDRTRGKNELGT